MRTSPWVRAGVACAVGGALCVLGAAPGDAAAARAGYTATSFSYTVHVGPGDATACHIVGELFVPAGASASHPEPAILTTNGFGGSYSDQVPLAEYFAGSQHYVVLAYSGLGFGGSGCNIELDSPQWDGRAASQLVSYLGRLPEVVKDGPDDPRVGMIGDSYGGAVQFAAASVDPRIDAIVPQITWNNLAYSLAPNNLGANVQRSAAVPGVLKDEWITYFFADGATTPISEYKATPFPPSSCPGYTPQVCPDLATSATEGYPSAATVSFLRAASMITYHRKVHVPTLLMQGEDDTLFNIDEAIANAQELRAGGSPVKLVLQSWGHSNDVSPAPGELSYTAGTKAYETILIDDWFDRYLRREKVSTGPAVEFYRPWISYSGSASPAYGSAGRIPVGRRVQLYLSGPATTGGEGTLTTDRGAVVGGTADFVNPTGGAPESYSETSVVQFEPPFKDIPPTDAPGSYAAWETPVLGHTIDSIGVPTLRFTLDAFPAPVSGEPASDPVVFTKLYAVSPSGTKTLADRLVAPTRIPDPGEPITVTLPTEVQHFPKGDRIELVVAASDEAYIGNRAPDTYSITVDKVDPPVLTLPENSPSQERGGGHRAAGEPGGPPAPPVPPLPDAPSPSAAATSTGLLAQTGWSSVWPALGVLFIGVGLFTVRRHRRPQRG